MKIEVLIMEKKFTITCNEEQLMLMSNAIEDWTRFLCGQCEMWNGTSMLENGLKIREILDTDVKLLVTPELPRGASYGWSGGDCPNKYQHKAIAMGYGIYRQIRHFFACRRKTDGYDVYESPTLTCKEQGPLIEVKEIC